MKHTELEIIPVKGSIITTLVTRIPSIKKNDILELGSSTVKLLEYCIGWGVVDEPPTDDEELNELCELFEAETIRKRRIVWVMHIVCKNQGETLDLAERIMEIS